MIPTNICHNFIWIVKTSITLSVKDELFIADFKRAYMVPITPSTPTDITLLQTGSRHIFNRNSLLIFIVLYLKVSRLNLSHPPQTSPHVLVSPTLTKPTISPVFDFSNSSVTGTPKASAIFSNVPIVGFPPNILERLSLSHTYFRCYFHQSNTFLFTYFLHS